MPLVDMKMEKKNEEPKEVGAINYRIYPCGLEISLNDESIKKLELDKDIKVGEKRVLLAEVEVMSVSEYQYREGEDRHVHLQIQQMSLKPVEKKKDAAQALYGEGGE